MKHWIQEHLPARYKLHFSKAEHLSETFVEQPYHWLAERLRPDTVVIDIGGSIGDTALYFAQFPNVSKVISFEPTPGLYNGAMELLQKCPLKGKIEFNNAAVSDKEGFKIGSKEVLDSRQFSTMKEQHGGRKIQLYTLNQITKDIHKPIAIKCDCEGDEKIIFPDADLSKVYAIILEDHWYCRDEMKRVFAGKGFKTVELTSLNKEGSGMLGAWRD